MSSFLRRTFTIGRVVHIEVGEDGVALITLNKPPVNSLDNSGPESGKFLILQKLYFCG